MCHCKTRLPGYLFNRKTCEAAIYMIYSIVKVCPLYATRHRVAQPRSKSRAMPQVYVDVALAAAACRSMLHSLKIRSANCRSHQRKPRGIWWVSGFKMVLASLKKKIRPSSPISFPSFCNLKKVCKKLFSHVDAIA